MTPELGKTAEDFADGYRDAIHVAIFPAVAAEKLAPGQDVGIRDGKATTDANHIGIVDPFLEKVVFPDQKVWICLYPNSVTGMRHEWSFPELDNITIPGAPADSFVSADESREWLRSFADAAGLPYSEMVSAVRRYAEHGDVWVEQGGDDARDAFDSVDKDEFWRHMESAEGISAPEDPDWYSPFSCSC